MTDGNAEMSRRAFLATAAGTAATAGAAGTAAAQETETGTETESSDGGGDGTETGTGTESSDGGGDGTETGTGTESSDGGGGGTETVEVGPDGELVFTPGTDEPLEITPGTTVEFIWESDNHNIVVDSQPEDAEWEGHEPLENSGFEYEYTFEVEGTYEYYCEPHEASGMVGTIEVSESAGGGDDGGSTASVPTVPDSAKTLGVATTFAMIATLGLAFFFLKYGGDYEIEE